MPNTTKTRTDSRLFQLTEEEQAQLYDWILTIGYAQAKERLALPPPDGCGLRTHLSSLYRFFLRYSAQHEEDHVVEAENSSRPDPKRLLAAAERVVHSGAFLRSASPMAPDEFREVSRWITEHKSHELRRDYYELAEQNVAIARQRLQFDREKWEFDIAHQVLLHHATLDQIVHDPDIKDAEKINRARAALFRTPVDQLPGFEPAGNRERTPQPTDSRPI